MAYQLFVHLSLSLTKFSVTDFSASIWARVFKFCIQDGDNQMHYWKQNQGAEIYFCLLFLFFPFSISHSKVINMEIFVKRFLRNYLTLDFEIWYKHQIWQGKLCIKESATYSLSVPLFVLFSFFFLFFFFLSLQTNFLWKCYNLWWLPPGVCELCSLLAIFAKCQMLNAKC